MEDTKSLLEAYEHLYSIIIQRCHEQGVAPIRKANSIDEIRFAMKRYEVRNNKELVAYKVNGKKFPV